MKKISPSFIVFCFVHFLLSLGHAQTPIPPGPRQPQGSTATRQNPLPSHLPLPNPPAGSSQERALPPEELTPGGEPKGKLLKTYRKDKRKNSNEALPTWVDKSLKHSKDHLKDFKNAFRIGLIDADAELELLGADENNLETTHVRLEQIHKGVPVFGSQIIIHLKKDKVYEITGYILKEVRQVDTKPKLDAAQAIEAAKISLGYKGGFAEPPDAALVILPHQIKDPAAAPGATLVYRVELLIEDGTNATARWLYFVNAQDGSIVWRYDAMNRGSGQSLYSGVVSFPTGYYNYNY